MTKTASILTARRLGLAALSLVLATGSLVGPTTGTAFAKTDRDLMVPQRYSTLPGSYLAGRMAIARRDIESAALYFQSALLADPGNPALLDRAFPLLVAAGRIRDALPLSERILGRDKSNAYARLTLGVDAIRSQRMERARQQFQQMKVGPLTDLTSGILTAWAYQGQGDTDNALKALDKITGPEWYGIFKNFHAGLIADAAGRKMEAVKRLTAARTADPNTLRVTDAYARALARSGDRDGALKAIAEFGKTVPDHPQMTALKGAIETGQSIDPLVASAASGSAELLYGLGSVIGRDGGEEMAAVYLQLAIALDPKAELPLISMATLYGKLKDYEKSIEVLGRIPVDSVLRPMTELQVGRYYNQLQKPDIARAHIQLIVDKKPKDIEAAMALADVLRAEKKYAEAADAYTRAIALIGTPEKSDWMLFYYRGIAFERSKQWPKAEPDFLKALELNPNESDILNYLGYSWIDMGINLDKGLDMVKQAVQLQPDNGFIIDSLGWAYYRLNRFDEAVETLEKAVAAQPGDPTINDHLGDAYWRAGRKLEATFQWAHARDLKPEAADLPRIMEKLKVGLADEKPTNAAANTPAPAPALQP